MGYRYIGSKTQIVNEVLKEIRRIVGDRARVADIMCGTASVSAALRSSGYHVIANDVMTYSYHHARVALEFCAEPEFKGLASFVEKHGNADKEYRLFPASNYEAALSALSRVSPKQGYFWKEFSLAGAPKNGERPRNYFTPENAAKIDGIRASIKKFKEQRLLSDLEYSLLIHDLVMAANDVANIAGTYGHYLSKTVERAKLPIALVATNLQIRRDSGKHKVYRGYAEEIAKLLECDLVYIDPPYMKRQYAANYHILETLARGDNPVAAGMSGLRPWRDQYSNFCTKTKIRTSFRQIFQSAKCKHFLVSYSEDGLLSINDLKELCGEFGKVHIHSVRNRRFKSNESTLAPVLTEYLIHIAKT